MAQGHDIFVNIPRTSTPQARVADPSVVPEALAGLSESFGLLAEVVYKNKQEGKVLDAKVFAAKASQEVEQSLAEETDIDVVTKKFSEGFKKIREKLNSFIIDGDTKRRIDATYSHYMLKASANAGKRVLTLQNAKQRADLIEFINLTEKETSDDPNLMEASKEFIAEAIDGLVETGAITADKGAVLKFQSSKRMDAVLHQQELGEAEALILEDPDAYFQAKENGVLGDTITQREEVRLDKRARSEKALQLALKVKGLPGAIEDHLAKIERTGVGDTDTPGKVEATGNPDLIAEFNRGVENSKDVHTAGEELKKAPAKDHPGIIASYMKDQPVLGFAKRELGERRVKAISRGILTERRKNERRQSQEAGEGLLDRINDYLAGVQGAGEGGLDRDEIISDIKAAKNKPFLEKFFRREEARKKFHALSLKLPDMSDQQREKALKDFLGGTGEGLQDRSRLLVNLQSQVRDLDREKAAEERERLNKLMVGMSQDQRDSIAQMRKRGHGIAGVAQRVRDTKDANLIKRFGLAEESAKREFEAGKALLTATPAGAAAIIRENVAGTGFGFEERDRRFDRLQLKSQAIRKAQLDDPGGYVEGVLGIGPNDGSQAAITITLAAQAHLGLAPHEQKPLTKDGKNGSDTIVDTINFAIKRKDWDTVYTTFKEAIGKAGRHRDAVIRQLDLPAHFNLLTIVSPSVGRVFLEANGLSDTESRELLDKDTLIEVDEKSAEAVLVFLNSLPPGLAAEAAQFKKAFIRYARLKASQGDANPQETAFRDLFPGYGFVGKVRIPREVISATAGIKPFGDSALVPGGVGAAFKVAVKQLVLDKLPELDVMNNSTTLDDRTFQSLLKTGIEFRTDGKDAGVFAYFGGIKLMSRPRLQEAHQRGLKGAEANDFAAFGFTFAQMISAANIEVSVQQLGTSPLPSAAQTPPSVRELLERRERGVSDTDPERLGR